MGELQKELGELEAGEKERGEREITAARERQAAIEGMEKEVSTG